MISMLHKFIHTLSMCITIYLVATASSFAFTDKQGPFEWHPEKSSRGPVVIIVSLTDQQVSVYRGGIRIARAPVSTGKPGHRTPTGVFTILQKDVHHHSSKYNNASMPYAERLTWSGVALHAGGLPGYPESHGCIHLSLEFSKKLFSITHIGTAVIIADTRSAPGDVTHPGPFLSAVAKEYAQEAVNKISKKKIAHSRHKNVADRTKSAGVSSSGKSLKLGHTSILASSKDKVLQVWSGDIKILDAPITIANPGHPIGTHLYTLSGVNTDLAHAHWSSVHISGERGGAANSSANVIKRINMSKTVATEIISMLHPGTSFLITDQSLSAKTRASNGFVVMRQK